MIKRKRKYAPLHHFLVVRIQIMVIFLKHIPEEYYREPESKQKWSSRRNEPNIAFLVLYTLSASKYVANSEVLKNLL